MRRFSSCRSVHLIVVKYYTVTLIFPEIGLFVKDDRPFLRGKVFTISILAMNTRLGYSKRGDLMQTSVIVLVLSPFCHCVGVLLWLTRSRSWFPSLVNSGGHSSQDYRGQIVVKLLGQLVSPCRQDAGFQNHTEFEESGEAVLFLLNQIDGRQKQRRRAVIWSSIDQQTADYGSVWSPIWHSRITNDSRSRCGYMSDTLWSNHKSDGTANG